MDNHHVTISYSAFSCGVASCSSLGSDPEKILYALASNLYHPAKGSPYAFAIWSDTEGSNGLKLAELVDSLFGLLQNSEWVENPKTSNLIRVWLWQIPHEDFKKWYIEQRIEKAKKL